VPSSGVLRLRDVSVVLGNPVHELGLHSRFLRLPDRRPVLGKVRQPQPVQVLRLAASQLPRGLRLPTRILHLPRISRIVLSRRGIAGATCATLTIAASASAVPAAGRGTASGCTAARSARLVHSLVSAFNAGNVAAVDRMVARKPAFQWFSVVGPTSASRRLGAAAHDRSTLGTYVRLRHRYHERWTHVTVKGVVGLALTLDRRADDVPLRKAVGKAEVICTGRTVRIIVWSI